MFHNIYIFLYISFVIKILNVKMCHKKQTKLKSLRIYN